MLADKKSEWYSSQGPELFVSSTTSARLEVYIDVMHK